MSLLEKITCSFASNNITTNKKSPEREQSLNKLSLTLKKFLWEIEPLAEDK